jgi:hypothetical protein
VLYVEVPQPPKEILNDLLVWVLEDNAGRSHFREFFKNLIYRGVVLMDVLGLVPVAFYSPFYGRSRVVSLQIFKVHHSDVDPVHFQQI